MSTEDLALRVAALKVVSDYATRRYNEARAEAAAKMRRGDRLMGRSPLGEVKVGAVSKSDPKATARISDEQALTRWIAEHYPEHVAYDFDIVGSHEEVAAVLFEHAPHLLRKITIVDQDTIKRIKSESAALGAPVGPGGEADIEGIEVTVPEGVVSCKPDPNALAAVIDLFRSNQLSFESLVHPELPGGEQ